MPLICPNCKQTKTFSGSGIEGKMKCFECNTIFPIDGNFVEVMCDFCKRGDLHTKEECTEVQN
jgi:hypothetical protein